MEILLFKVTQESDLHVGLKVCYRNQQGGYSKLGVITDILDTEPNKSYLINTSMGAYLANELKLIKQA
jgi:hypothetical protein